MEKERKREWGSERERERARKRVIGRERDIQERPCLM